MASAKDIDSLRALFRQNATQTDPEIVRRQTVEALTALGFRLPATLGTAAPDGALLVIGSQRNATLSLYELPADDTGLWAALASLTGSTFAALDELEDQLRGDAARILVATRQTGLGPDEVVGWLSDLGAAAAPTEAELTELDERWASRYLGGVGDGASPEIAALRRFDRVFGFVYDGD